MAQKSWPSGAPSRAAAACIAVTPGATAMSSLSHSRVFFDRLEHSRRHREHARIAARDDGDFAAFRRKFQRKASAVHLNPIVAREWAALIRPQGQPLHIRAVADNVARRRNRGGRFRGHPLGRAGSQSHNHDAPAHGRRPLPGARMIEK